MFDEIRPDAYGLDLNMFYLVLYNELKHFEYWVNYKCVSIIIFSFGVMDKYYWKNFLISG